MSSDDGTLVHGDMAPDHPSDTNEDAAEDTTLLAHATKIASTSPGDLQQVLSNSMAKFSGKRPPAKPCSSDREITVNSQKYRQINMARLIYIASAHCDNYIESLVDCGANGGIAGEDAKIINKNG